MSNFVPTGTFLYWHLTSSWKSGSNSNFTPATYATASTLPNIDDNVFMNNNFVEVDMGITNPLRVKTIRWLSTGSIIEGGSLVLDHNFVRNTNVWTMEVTDGLWTAFNSINQVPISFNNNSAVNASYNNIYIQITSSIYAGLTNNQHAFVIREIDGANIAITGSLIETQTGKGVIRIASSATNTTLTINGLLRGSSGSLATAAPVIVNEGANSIININGDILATGSSQPIIDLNANGSILNCIGNIETRTSQSAIRIRGSATNFTYVTLGSETTPINIVNSGSGAVLLVSNGTTLSASVDGLNTQVILYGNYSNTNVRNNIIAPRIYISSSNITFATASGTTTITLPPSNITDPTPTTTDVYMGVVYGNNNSKTGVLTTPSSSNVRSTITYSSGSVGATPSSTAGTVAMPPQNDVRFGVRYDTVTSGGAMIVPVASQVSASFGFESYNVSGSYSGSTEFWATPHTTITTGIGALISQSLNVRVGSITGSLIGLLDTDTSNTVTRLRSIAGVADVGNALTQSANI
jgi:hypothetical protein